MFKNSAVKPFFLKEGHAYTGVMLWFFAYPAEGIGLNDLSTVVKASKTSVKIAVLKLRAQGFLTLESRGKIWWIKANQAHPFMLTRKMPYHLQLIYESKLLDIVRKQVPNARTILLFGSYRKGDDTPKSDLDIAAEVAGEQELEIKKIGTLKLGYREAVPVNLHIFSRKNVDLNLYANIANGIVLEGFLEVHL